MDELFVFVPACLALNLSLGPNNILALNRGYQIGVGFAVTAGLARLLVFVPMIAVSACGLGVMLSSSDMLYSIVKFGGTIYLCWLGISLLRNSHRAKEYAVASGNRGVLRAFRQEAVAATGNPKAILIFTAFFPQFVNLETFAQSYFVLGTIFLGLEAIAISFYALVGRFAASLFASQMHSLNRASGCSLIAFGIALLFSEPPGHVG